MHIESRIPPFLAIAALQNSPKFFKNFKSSGNFRNFAMFEISVSTKNNIHRSLKFLRILLHREISEIPENLKFPEYQIFRPK